MALPTLVRTWQFRPNQAIFEASSLLTGAKILFRIKESLLGGGTGWLDSAGAAVVTPAVTWAVRGSSNAVTFVAPGGGSPDKWVTEADVVSGFGSRSWIVLRNTALGAQYEVCWDFRSSASQSFEVFISPGGLFTGGSLSARPTASDEIAMPSSVAGNTSTNTNHQLHIVKDTAGLSTRVFLLRNGILAMVMLLEKPANVVSGWSAANYAAALSTGTAVPPQQGTYAQLFSDISVAGRSVGLAGTTIQIYMTCEGSQSGTNALVPQKVGQSPFSLEYPLFPIGIASLTPANASRLGSMVDLYASVAGLSDGTTYPASSGKTWVTFGNTVHPWCTVVPAVT